MKKKKVFHGIPIMAEHIPKLGEPETPYISPMQSPIHSPRHSPRSNKFFEKEHLKIEELAKQLNIKDIPTPKFEDPPKFEDEIVTTNENTKTEK